MLKLPKYCDILDDKQVFSSQELGVQCFTIQLNMIFMSVYILGIK